MEGTGKGTESTQSRARIKLPGLNACSNACNNKTCSAAEISSPLPAEISIASFYIWIIVSKMLQDHLDFKSILRMKPYSKYYSRHSGTPTSFLRQLYIFASNSSALDLGDLCLFWFFSFTKEFLWYFCSALLLHLSILPLWRHFFWPGGRVFWTFLVRW